MSQVTPRIVLNTLIKHETLTLNDLAKEENLGITCDEVDLQQLLDTLENTGFVDTLNDVLPVTYTVTTDGIAEGARLNEAEYAISY
jgi:hypothetical protein